MRTASDMFKPGRPGDLLANELAGLLAGASGGEFPEGHRFRLDVLDEMPHRMRAELAILWALKPGVFRRLGGLE